MLKVDFNYSETVINAQYQSIIFSLGKTFLSFDVMVQITLIIENYNKVALESEIVASP